MPAEREAKATRAEELRPVATLASKKASKADEPNNPNQLASSIHVTIYYLYIFLAPLPLHKSNSKTGTRYARPKRKDPKDPNSDK